MSSKVGAGGRVNLGVYTVDLMTEIGRGTFGTVYKGKHIKTEVPVAVKKMQVKDDTQGQTALEEIKKFEWIEAHPNVVQLFDFQYRDDAFWMVMDFCELGDLDAFMKDRDLGFGQKLVLMGQCASALAHMHNQKPAIMHRDIKPGNILIKNEKGSGVVKLTDFGLSRMVDLEELMKTKLFTSVVGTPGFMAPELYEQQAYNLAVDVFALGLVFLALIDHVKGQTLCPMSSMGAMMSIGMEMVVKHKSNDPMPQYVKDAPGDSDKAKEVRSLIRRMIQYKKGDRPTMTLVDKSLSLLRGVSSGSTSSSAAGGGGESPTSSLHFHPTCGHNATITNRGLGARKAKDEYTHAVVMSHRPLAVNERLEIRIDTINTRWSGSIKIGVTSQHPQEMEFPATITDLRQGAWVMAGTSIFKHGEKVINEYGIDLRELKAGDRVGLMLTADEKLHIYVNDHDQGVAARYLPDSLYAMVDLYGCVESVSIIDHTSGEAAQRKSDAAGYMFTRKQPAATSSVGSATSSVGSTSSEEEGLGMQFIRQALEEMTGGRQAGRQAGKRASAFDLLQDVFDSHSKFREGEKVVTDNDVARARRLQEGRGGWVDGMEKYLGKQGTVTDVRARQIELKFLDGQTLWFNPDLVHKLDSQQAKVAHQRWQSAQSFSPNNIVQLLPNRAKFEAVMRRAGLWRDWLVRVVGLTGIVHSVDEDGDVKVELITSEKVHVHPDALVHVPQTDLDVEAGDMVFVKTDLAQVKANQQGFGGWNPKMANLCGRATLVTRVVGQKAILEDDDNHWAFNVKSLLIVAKNKNLMQALMAKKRAEAANSIQALDDLCKVQ